MSSETQSTERELPILARDHPDARAANFWIVWAAMTSPLDGPLRDAIRVRAALRIHCATYRDRPGEMVSFPAGILFPLADDEVMERLYGGADRLGARVGCVAGFVLCYLNLLWRSDPKSASLNKAIHMASKHAEKVPAWGDGARVAATPRQILKFWTDSKSVAHLWLAWNMLEERVTEPDGMELLLSVAEGFRLWFEGFIPYRTSKPLVEPGEMWRPAAGRVQPRDLGARESPLPEELSDWLKSYRAPMSI